MARISKDNLLLAMMRIESSDEPIIDKVIKQFEINGFKVEARNFIDTIILYIDDKDIIEFHKKSKIFEWIDPNYADRYLMPYKKALDIVNYLRMRIRYEK